MVDLCHFGEDCAPEIIINHILKQSDKQLFMLGIYPLNNILTYLNDCNYERIYDKEQLVIIPETCNLVEHKEYKLAFNHDYKIVNSQINNYELVRDRFDLKIKNFREMMLREKLCVFILFTKNLDSLKITDALEWLSLNKKHFHLMIFTSNVHTTVVDSKLCSIINLKNKYDKWYRMENETKIALYQEVYDEFISCLTRNSIQHEFPQMFSDTEYQIHLTTTAQLTNLG